MTPTSTGRCPWIQRWEATWITAAKNGTVGYGVLENIWRAVMAAWDMEDGKITQVQLYPISLGLHDKRPHKGLPRMSGSEET